MKIVITPDGSLTHIYSDEINIEGDRLIRRAAHVEPEKDKWYVYHNSERIAGPFNKRSEALKAEVDYVENNLLNFKDER